MDSFDPSSSFPPLPLPPLPPVFDPTQPNGLGYGEARAEPRRVWTVFVAFVVALVAGLLASGIVPLIYVAAQATRHMEDRQELVDAIAASILKPTVLLGSGAATQLMLLLTATCAALLSPVPFSRRLRLNPSSLSYVGYFIVPVGALAISFLFGALVSLLGIQVTGPLKLLGESFRHLTPLELIAAVLIVGIGPGFAEEFLFRGYTQTRLVQRWGRWIGITITALLFGIMHMDLLQGTFVIGFGFYVGYLVEKCGSIRPGMVCHAFNNSVQVILARFATGSDEQTPRSGAAILALIALCVLVSAIIYIRFRVRPAAESDIGFPGLPAPQPQPVPAIVYQSPT